MEVLPRSSGWRSAAGRDLLLAVALAVAMAAVAAVAGPASAGARVGAVVAAGGLLALAQRRRRPLTAMTAVAVVVVVEVVASPQGNTAPAFLAIMVGAYSLGAYATAWSLVAGLAVATAGVATAQYLGPAQGYSHASADSFLVGLLVLAPAVVGGVMGARKRLALTLEEGTRRLRAARQERIEAAVARERQRISADLEAVLLGGLNEARAHASVADLADVRALERIARDLLTRMRQLVGELRAPHPDDRAPAQPVAELRAQVQAALAAAEVAEDSATEESAATGAGTGARAVGRWTLVGAAWWDTVLAATAGLMLVELVITRVTGAHPDVAHRLANAILAAGIAAPLGWARRRPLGSATTSLAFALAYMAVAAPADPLAGVPPCGVLVVSPFMIGAACATRRAVAGLALCVAGCVALVAADSGATVAASALPGSVAVIVGCWAAGRALRAGTAAVAAHARAAIAVDEQHRTDTRAALDAQRARLARDLHDAAGHVMTVIVLQAAAARRVWDTDPTLAAEHAAALRSTVAEALDELGPLVLSVALADAHAPIALAGLPTLASRARSCGLRVELNLDPGPTPLPPQVGAAAYRIVQEALTNAARHAPGALVRVDVTRTGKQLAVEVRNHAATRSVTVATRAGHGLRGMAERSEACGGSLVAGPQPDGGFGVHARLPLEAPA
ncbi:hypothetical protein HC031_21750 [Planosporangium thailandense]|uniref:histidine kinase n=1 Tax=Planosporangium thailandense TaxID=765197 RepID=A0ABX0Y4I7_9ACTN|nr:histidine kinase [Planosporangium thailandense]NJC72320.1 hypothetical protein [Planosporangium thailandense]